MCCVHGEHCLSSQISAPQHRAEIPLTPPHSSDGNMGVAQSRYLKRTLEQCLTNREAQNQIAVTVTHIVNMPDVAQFSSLRCLMLMPVDFTSIIKAHCSFPLWQVPSICFPYPTADLPHHPPLCNHKSQPHWRLCST